MVYTGHDVTWGNIPTILQAHATVRQSGLPNFMGCRIPVQTQLKVLAWKKYSRTSVIRPSIIRISRLTEPKSCLPTYKTRSSVSDNTRFYTVSETMNSSVL